MPITAVITRDIQHRAIDMGLATDGTIWLLADDGIWSRPLRETAWKQDAALGDLGGSDVGAAPYPELVVDSQGAPWLLRPSTGDLWHRTGPNQWQNDASGLVGATGLSVGTDGSAYAVAPGTPGDLVRVRGGAVSRLTNEGWKQPVATGFDTHGNLFVVDAGSRQVARVGSDVRLSPIPTAIGHLSVGRDADGNTLVVGGTQGVIAMKVGDVSLSFPTLPTTALPVTTGSFTGLRLFGLPDNQFLAMARSGDGSAMAGELRLVTVPARPTGTKYAPATVYTGTPITLRTLMQREADKQASGFVLAGIRGSQKDSACNNRSSAWVYVFSRAEDHQALLITVGPTGVMVERDYLPANTAMPTPLADVPMDANEAWAKAVQFGMPNAIKGDVTLTLEGNAPIWRILWTVAGQTYKVNALTGEAGLDKGT